MSIGLAQDINGKWKGQMQSPNGPMGELPITNGKIDGKIFFFQVNAGEMTISHQCFYE